MKKPKYEPFKADDPIMFLDNESVCNKKADNIEEMSLDKLISFQNQLAEALFDWETVIDIELNSKVGFDKDSLADSRRQAQKVRVELREVKKRIRMINNLKGVAAS